MNFFFFFFAQYHHLAYLSFVDSRKIPGLSSGVDVKTLGREGDTHMAFTMYFIALLSRNGSMRFRMSVHSKLHLGISDRLAGASRCWQVMQVYD